MTNGAIRYLQSVSIFIAKIRGFIARNEERNLRFNSFSSSFREDDFLGWSKKLDLKPILILENRFFEVLLNISSLLFSHFIPGSSQSLWSYLLWLVEGALDVTPPTSESVLARASPRMNKRAKLKENQLARPVCKRSLSRFSVRLP